MMEVFKLANVFLLLGRYKINQKVEPSLGLTTIKVAEVQVYKNIPYTFFKKESLTDIRLHYLN